MSFGSTNIYKAKTWYCSEVSYLSVSAMNVFGGVFGPKTFL